MSRAINVLTGPIFSLRGEHLYSVACCCIIPERLLAVSADEGGALVVWDLKLRKALDKRHLGYQILSLSYFIDAERNRCIIFVQQRNGFILAFSLTDKLSEAPLYRIKCAEYSYCRHTISKSGAMVIPASDMNHVEVIDCRNQEVIVNDFPSISSHGDIMAVDTHDNTLAVGFEDGFVLLYNLNPETMNSSLIADLRVLSDSITCLSFDSSGRLIVGGACNQLKIVDGNFEISLSNAFRDSGVSSITTINDYIISGGWDGKVRVLDRSLGVVQVTDDSIFNNVMDVCAVNLPRPIPGKDLISRIHDVVITCSKDCSINVWQISG
jgi:WD40 repeat protein